MNSHQLSKLTTSARKPPVIPGTNMWSTTKELANKKTELIQDYSNDDADVVDQREPPNFQPVTNTERSGLQSFVTDRNKLTSQFYDKIQELKKEHQKTLTLLNQFYQNEKNKENPDNRTRTRNHLVPDYLAYTENNTLLHGNRPDRGSDAVPGYSKPDLLQRYSNEKADSIKDSEVSSNTDSAEVVGRMWEDFSLDEYIDKGNRRPEKKKSGVKVRPQSAPLVRKKEWSPVITIPKPFNMTLRDERKSGKSHTRSSMEVSMRERMREEEEEQERLRRIRARDPPAHIYLPLYEEMCERREQRSRFNRENSVATTMALQKPFSFAERDEHKRRIKELKKQEEEQCEIARIKEQCNFEAQPVPSSVRDSSVHDRMVEDILYRKIKAKLRSEDLMRASVYPPRMRSHEALARRKKNALLDQLEEQTSCSFRPQTSEMPDFDLLPRHESRNSHNPPLETTVVRPFKFHTPSRSNYHTVTQESYEEERRSTPIHEPGKVPVFSDTLPTRMTDSARLRLGNMRRSLQEADDAIKKEKEKEKVRSERRKSLAMKVKQKAALNESTGTTATSGDEKLRQYKKELRERQIRYNQFLQDVKKKVEERPLLIEQHDEKIAKAQAERRYQNILEASGLSDEFVEKNTKSRRYSPDLDRSNGNRESYSADERPETKPKEFVEILEQGDRTGDASGATDGGSEILDTSHGDGRSLKKVKKHVEFA